MAASRARRRARAGEAARGGEALPDFRLRRRQGMDCRENCEGARREHRAGVPREAPPECDAEARAAVAGEVGAVEVAAQRRLLFCADLEVGATPAQARFSTGCQTTTRAAGTR